MGPMTDLSALTLDELLWGMLHPGTSYGERVSFCDELRRRFAVLSQEKADAEKERDLAVAHDRQPYPTAWAYEQACKALAAAERDRDRLREALRPFLEAADAAGLGYDEPADDDYVHIEVKARCFDVARAALSEGGADATGDCTFPDCAEGDSAPLCEGPCKLRSQGGGQ